MEEKKSNAIAIRYNDSLKIAQANELIRSKQDSLTLLETRLVRLAISQILKGDSDLQTYTTSARKLGEFLKIHPDNIYRDLHSLSQNLMKKSIFIVDSTPPKRGSRPNYKILHWIDYIEYKDGIITFKLSDGLKPYLIGLNKMFALYSYEDNLSLSSVYHIRCYELLVSYQEMALNKHVDIYDGIPIGEREFILSIEWLREYFNCKDKYPNANNFIEKVIGKAITEINEETYMRVSFKPIKKGRSIKYVLFRYEEWTEEDIRKFLSK